MSCREQPTANWPAINTAQINRNSDDRIRIRGKEVMGHRMRKESDLERTQEPDPPNAYQQREKKMES